MAPGAGQRARAVEKSAYCIVESYGRLDGDHSPSRGQRRPRPGRQARGGPAGRHRPARARAPADRGRARRGQDHAGRARSPAPSAAAFQRIQFTSDMLPSDVLGVSVWEPKHGEFVFKPGPLFTNIVLADEINRTTPKTQSALLEAMNEAQVSLDHSTYPLPAPVHGAGHPEPARVRGHLPAARVAARPLPAPPPHRLSRRGGREGGAARRDRAAARGRGPGGAGRGGAEPPGSGRARARRGVGARLPRRAGDRHPAVAAARRSASARADRWPCSAPRAPARSPTGATTCCPTTSRSWPAPRWVTGSS